MTGDAAVAVQLPLLRRDQQDLVCWRLAPLSVVAGAPGELAVMSLWLELPVLLCCPQLLLLPGHPGQQQRSSTRAPRARLFFPLLAPRQVPLSGGDDGRGDLLLLVATVVVVRQ